MKNQKITAVIPCFNHEKYIEERLCSILSQSSSVHEIIFLDDASNDQSVVVAQKVLQGCSIPVRYQLNKVNSGSVFKQWNRGVAMSSGDLIWIAESDDTCGSNFVHSCMIPLRDPNCVLAYAKSSIIDENSRIASSLDEWGCVFSPYPWGQSFSMDGNSFVSQYMVVRNVIPNASSVIFRKASYISAGGASEHLKMCGDWLVWGKMSLQGRIAYTVDAQNFFRRHQANTHTNSRIDIVREHIEVEYSLLRAMSSHPKRLSQDQKLQILQDLLDRGLMCKSFGYWASKPGLFRRLLCLIGRRNVASIYKVQFQG